MNIDTDKDPQPQIIPSTGDAILGQDFSFTCITYGKRISFTWFKDGKAVPNNHTDTAVKGTDSTFYRKVLMIKRATKVDEGNYTCRVTAALQPGYTKDVTAKLKVKGTQSSCFMIV